jgi:hypothetical protein
MVVEMPGETPPVLTAGVPKKKPVEVNPIPEGNVPVYSNEYGPVPPVAASAAPALE